MAIDSIKNNMFAQGSGWNPVGGVKKVGGQSAGAVGGATESKNPFAGEMFKGQTVGLNSMQPGDSVFTPAQAGKAAGVSRLIANA